MILPVGAASFKEAMKMGVEVYHHLKVTRSPFCLLFILVVTMFSNFADLAFSRSSRKSMDRMRLMLEMKVVLLPTFRSAADS